MIGKRGSREVGAVGIQTVEGGGEGIGQDEMRRLVLRSRSNVKVRGAGRIKHVLSGTILCTKKPDVGGV